MENIDKNQTDKHQTDKHQTDKHQTGEYKKVLNLYDLILSNIGYIIGAGIFVLIGKTINIAGNTAWISVILSGLFISLC